MQAVGGAGVVRAIEAVVIVGASVEAVKTGMNLAGEVGGIGAVVGFGLGAVVGLGLEEELRAGAGGAAGVAVVGGVAVAVGATVGIVGIGGLVGFVFGVGATVGRKEGVFTPA